MKMTKSKEKANQMVKFKVGDTVKLISNNSDSLNRVGDVGIIVELTEVDCRVQVKGGFSYANWSPFIELELVEVEE